MSTAMVTYQQRSFVRRALDRVAAWLGYEGARPRRESDGIPVGGANPDDVISPSLAGLRAHSHHMVRNHWAGSRAVDVLTAKIVGGGIRPSSTDQQLNDMLSSWSKPQAQVGARKGQSLASVQRLAIRTVIESGAAIVIRRPQSRAEMRKKNLVVPMVVQVYEPDWLDMSREDFGIEVGKDGWVEKYHLRDPNGWSNETFVYDSKDVCYVMLEQRSGQRLSVPWMTPALRKMRDFDQFEDAELMRAKIASMFAAFVKSPANLTGQGDPTLTLEPGRIQQLAPGEDITLTEPPDAGGYEAFARSQIRSISAAFGLSYEDLSNDYSQVNYSSARMGALVTNRQVDIWRDELLMGLLCADLERWFLDAASLISKVQPADITWTPPAHDLIDPSKDIAASVMAIDAGLTSRQAEIRKRGRDPKDVADERRADAADEGTLPKLREAA